MIVSEIFGPTVQGEGPHVGLRCGFVRLGRCNLACTWCDTPYSWDWERYDPARELTEIAGDDIVRRVEAMGVDAVVVTGGEPLLQQRALAPLCTALRERGCAVHVETAGTLAWTGPDVVDQWVVSPKLANSAMPEERRLNFDALRDFAARDAAFKFVVVDAADLDEVAAIVEAAGVAPSAVWVMPEATTPEVLVARTTELADAVVARRWNLTTRLHVLAWGAARGR